MLYVLAVHVLRGSVSTDVKGGGVIVLSLPPIITTFNEDMCSHTSEMIVGS